MLNDIQKSILQTVSDMVSIPDGAVNIRLDGQKEFRQNSEHIQIVSKTDKDGIDIRIAPFTKSENVHIPVILSKSGFHDLVYNDFFVGEGADVTIVAGCGIHNCGDCDSEHDGIHTFYIGKNAKVHYIEKHYGEGEGSGKRILNPQTIVYLEEGASIVMDTSQIGGVDDTKRYTKCEANGANAEVQTLLLCAPLVRRENDPPTSICAALLVLLAQNPWSLLNVGLQLSFASTAGIVLFAGGVYRSLTCRRTLQKLPKRKRPLPRKPRPKHRPARPTRSL